MNAVSSKWLAGIGALIVVLITASVLVAVFGPGRENTEFPADSPEGVVQRYIRAVINEDPVVALSLMEAKAQEGCTIQEVTQQSRWFAESSRSRRIDLVDTRDLLDGKLQVRVRVTEVNVSPPFGINENSYDQWYTLMDEEGSWVLEYPAWPISWCQAVQEDLRIQP